MKTKIILLITVFIILIILISIPIYLYFIKPYTWGEKGSMELSISSDVHFIKYNESIDINYTLTNIGNSKIRILDLYGYKVSFYDPNNDKINLMKYEVYRPPTNDDLIVLKKNKTHIFHESIKIDDSWNYQSNITLKIIGSYFSQNHEDISYPYWKGNLTSNELYIITT